jgi:hypothetical protein
MANGDDTALLDPKPTPGAPGLSPGATTNLASPPAAADQDALDRAQERKQRAQMLEDYRSAQAEEVRIARARETEMAPLYRGYQGALEKYGRTSEEQMQRLLTKQQDIPEYKTPDLSQSAGNYMMLAATLGAITNAFGRAHTTAALDGMTGMLTGFNKGSLTAIEQGYKTWQANADRAIEYNRRMTDEYKAIMQNAKLNLDQRAAMIEMVANKYQDQMMIPQAQQKNITGMANLMFHQETAAERILLEQNKLKEHHDENIAKLKVKLAETGLKMDDDGNVTIDETPSSPMYQRAYAIATYGQAPIAGTRGGATQIMSLVDKISMQLTGQHYDASKWTGKNAYSRAAGTYGARVESATNEVGYFIPQALTASNGLPRGKWVPVNQVVNDARAGKSDPRYYDFATANVSLINAYARAVNPTGVPRIQDKEHIEKLLSTATSPQAYQAVLKRIAKEVRASHAAIALTRGEGQSEIDQKNNIMNMTDQQLDQYIDANGVNTEGTARLRVNIGTGEVTPGGGEEFPGFSIATPPVAPPTAAQ